MTVDELIERLEKETEGSPELDLEIERQKIGPEWEIYGIMHQPHPTNSVGEGPCSAV